MTHRNHSLLLLLGAVCAVWPFRGSTRAADAPPAGNAKSTGPLAGYEIVRLGEGPGNRLCLAATVGGKKGLMLLDTGAGGTSLNEATYGSLRGKNTELARGLPKTAGFNWTTAEVTVAPDFTVGKTNLGTLPVRLLPGRYLYDRAMIRSEEENRSYDGLMGEELLRHYHAVVDCGRLMLYLNTDPAKRHSLSGAFVRAGWTRVPMEDVGTNFAVTCVIKGHRFRLVVDTGAPFTVLTRSLVDTLHLDTQVITGMKMGIVATRDQEVSMLTQENMQVGDYVLPTTHIVVTPESFADFGGPAGKSGDGVIVGFLGSDALTTNGGVVDVGEKALYLRRGGAPR